MEKRDVKAQIRLITQALNAANSSVNLAKQLLSELETGGGGTVKAEGEAASPPPVSVAAVPLSTKDLPGVIGTFEGQNMVTADGQKFQVPENYASKSMIVYGDKLKMVEVGGETRFKQIERVKRQRAAGMLVKKDGRYTVVTSDGSYSILPSAVSHFDGKEGDEVHIVLPLSNKHVPFAAVESIGAKPVPSLDGKGKAPAPALKTEVKPAPVRVVAPVPPEKKVVAVKKEPAPKNRGPVVEKVKPLPKAERIEKTAKEEVEVKKTPPTSDVLIGDDELR